MRKQPKHPAVILCALNDLHATCLTWLGSRGAGWRTQACLKQKSGWNAMKINHIHLRPSVFSYKSQANVESLWMSRSFTDCTYKWWAACSLSERAFVFCKCSNNHRVGETTIRKLAECGANSFWLACLCFRRRRRCSQDFPTPEWNFACWVSHVQANKKNCNAN